MRAKTKTFDCVEMKNRIQASIWAEYEARKDEFPTFFDFVRHRLKQSEWAQQVLKKFGADT